MKQIFYFLCVAILASLVISCGGDEEEEEPMNIPDPCEGITMLEGMVDINGEMLNLTEVNLTVFTDMGSNFYDYLVSGIDDGCSSTQSISFTIEVFDGARLGGDYPIVDEFAANRNTAQQVKLTLTQISDASEAISEPVSGNVTIVNNGNRSYDININALLDNGSPLTMSVSEQF